MRTTAIALIVALGTWGLGPASALACFGFVSLGTWGTTLHAQEATAWRHVADAIPLGSKVRVQRVDGSRVSGTLMRVDDTSVMIKKNTRIPEAAVTVTYDQLAGIERDKGGMSWAKAIGIGLAAGTSAILTILVIALQWD